jgi:glutathione synthase/RimK-type ligase-like ATP-grasp enzyme
MGTTMLATATKSDAIDYRYALEQVGRHADLYPIELSEKLSQRCVHLTMMFGLEFSGIDLKITPDGEVVCFEVTPSPAFSYYEVNTGQPIAQTLAFHLARLEL